jgi:heme-degrading monooxygenase HmoA
MIAVIFEAFPAKSKWGEYLDIAATLKPELLKLEGFISIERFQSLSDPEKILSLSFWENEDSIRQWRNLELHREAQSRGRDSVFKDYRLRVAAVIRDYGMSERAGAPDDSKLVHDEKGK